MSIEHWNAVGRRQIYKGRIFTIWQDRLRSPQSGREHVFDVVDAPDWVNIVAVTGDDRVLLIHQYRAGTRSTTTEIPGGTVDPGESPLDAARRELLEETGYTSGDWSEIGRVEPNPAFQTNVTYTFLARGARRTGAQRLDETELIEVEERPLDEIPGLIVRGVIRHALVVCAFFHAAAAGVLRLATSRG
jgi:8-oxo-dGTP pyrophosphatase MutT (NUDIX family)